MSSKRDTESGDSYYEHDGVRYYVTPSSYGQSPHAVEEARLRATFPDLTPCELEFAFAPASKLGIPGADASRRVSALRGARANHPELSDATWEQHVREVTPYLSFTQRIDASQISSAVGRRIKAALESTRGLHRDQQIRPAIEARRAESDKWAERARKLRPNYKVADIAYMLTKERGDPVSERQVYRWLRKTKT